MQGHVMVQPCRPAADRDRSEADAVLADHQSTCKSAWELAHRLCTLKAAIFGPEPTGEGVGKDGPPASGFFPQLREAHDSTQAAIDRSHEIVAQIETQFSR